MAQQPKTRSAEVRARVRAVDWDRAGRDLDDLGYARLPRLLRAGECSELVRSYPDALRFRSHVSMERHRFGIGEYRYFSYPLPTLVARQYIASAIQFIVHIARLQSGERKVMRISEVCGCSDGVFSIEDLFVYRMTGVDARGRAEGSFYATGHEPVNFNRMELSGMQVPNGLFLPRELSTGGKFRA